jgi:hypothetical protein
LDEADRDTWRGSGWIMAGKTTPLLMPEEMAEVSHYGGHSDCRYSGQGTSVSFIADDPGKNQQPTHPEIWTSPHSCLLPLTRLLVIGSDETDHMHRQGFRKIKCKNDYKVKNHKTHEKSRIVREMLKKQKQE